MDTFFFPVLYLEKSSIFSFFLFFYELLSGDYREIYEMLERGRIRELFW